MSLTGNYKAAFELREEVVRDIFLEAWRSGEIHHEIQVNKTIQENDLKAVVKILQTGAAGTLSLSFDTLVANGIKMTLPLDVEAVVENSPAPSINPIKFPAGLEVTAPVQALPDTAGNKELVLNLAGLPDAQVKVNMPAAPILSVTEDLVEDGLHKAYDDGLIPHSVSFPLGPITITIDVDDDDLDPNRQIKFTLDAPDHGTITLPIFIHVLNGLEETVKVHNIQIIRAGDKVTFRFRDVTAADVETSLLLSPYKSAIAGMVSNYPDYEVFVPSNNTIADFIRGGAKQRLDTWGADGNGRIHIYTPNAVENLPIDIVDFVPVVKPTFLAVLFNPMTGADPNAVENFIPADKKFAQALAEPVVQEMIDTALKEKILDDNGCPGWPCKFDHEIEGHEVTLTNKPTFRLKDGHIQMEGSAEVAIDCWFDPDVEYEAKVKFYFETDAEGNKTIKPDIYDEDVDLSCLDWFLGLIIIIYGWIALIVVWVVIESVGGKVVKVEGDKIASGTEYLAGEIHGVGGVTTLLDQIDIKPGGIILSGVTFVVTATYALTFVPSESDTPYSGLAASLITLKAIHTHAKALHRWDFGDGNTAEGAQVQHKYIDDGIYIAKLTTSVDDPSGVATHHYARVKVDNVPPVVDARPDIVAKEGEVINFVGHFTDAEWVDKHEARWSWGDDSMDIGTVFETNNPPRAEGVVTGNHAYCDNGEYTVTLRVRDDDGGVGKDTLKVTVRNVAPTVDAGDDMFAYPCTPITLVARFTDPGWCDTHTGSWEFGDCTPRHPATIREQQAPPAGTGIAAATHVYNCCGTYLATCTVIDDDGGIGRDTIAVRVIDVLNRDFEGGFRNRRVGTVANEWEPYVTGRAASLAAEPTRTGMVVLFSAEEFVVHRGQRSQHIGEAGQFQAGIYQRVGANLNWDYQVSVWYHLDERGGGVCRLGIDQTGGTNPESADVQWSEGSEHRNWAQLLGRVTAQSHAITIFLQVDAEAGGIAYFDDVALIPYPCPLVEPEVPELPQLEGREACVDWKDEKEARDVGRVYEKKGFTFQAISQDSLRIVLWGSPEGQGKLALPQKGVRVLLPFAADRLVAHVGLYAGEPILMEAFDAAGSKVGQATTVTAQGEMQTLEVKSADITTLLFAGGGNEGLLIDLCAYQEAGDGDEQAQ